MTLNRLSWWLTLAALQMYGVSCPRRRALSPGFRESCIEGATLFPETRLSRAQAVLQCRRLIVKAGPPCL